jgi:ferredoxin-type protein NapF
MQNSSRRAFFKRASEPFASYIYPPYYKEKVDFSNCIECENKDCLLACEENIICIENEMPIIKFNENGCTFCDECANACPNGVLDISYKKDRLNCEMIIDTKSCVSWNQTICFACSDVCEYDAIKFHGLFNPVVYDEVCVGCGFCVGVCPSDSILVMIKKQKDLE